MCDINPNIFSKKGHFTRFFGIYLGMKVLRTVTLTVGAIMGAGFLSGAELVRFFSSEYFLPTYLGAIFLLGIILYFALFLGEKYGGFTATVSGMFPRIYPAVFTLFFLASFLSCASMMAGLKELLPRLAPWGIFLLAAGLSLLCERGAKGVSVLSLLLVPVTVGFILFQSGEAWEFRYPFSFGGGVFRAILYAGYNGALAFPVVCESGRGFSKKARVVTVIIVMASVAYCGACILGRVYREGANALSAPLPFLYAMRESKLFFAVCALAVCTSLSSALFSLFAPCEKIPNGAIKNAAKGISLLAAFALSKIGLSGVIAKLYPPLGMSGLLFLLLCILHEQFFQKHDEKVHSRRKCAQNAGRAHHEVELKHLPTVHD